MRLFFMTPSLGLGGAERWIVEMCRVLADFEVVGVWPLHRDAHPDILADLRAMKVPITLPGEKVDADVIISWGIPYPRKYIGPTRTPLVVVSHGVWPEAPEDFFDSQAYEATHITAVSQAAARAFREKYPVSVLYNGVPKQRVAVVEDPEVWRTRWRLEPHEKVVLQIGRLSREKKPDRLLEAARWLPADWVPVFCGDGVMKDQLIEQAKAMGRKVVFQSPVPAVGSLYAAADVVCVPSDREGMPLVVIEAWLSGTPVVCSEIPFAREMQDRHGDTILRTVSQAENPVCWISEIQKAAQTPNVKLEEYRALAEQEYTAEAMGDRWRRYLLDEVGR